MEQLLILYRGVKDWNEWRKENPEIKPDLRGVHLIVAPFSGANLSGVNLSDTDLREANFNATQLINANLSGANLWGASLRDADLREANLSGANLNRAILGRADLRYTNLKEANLSGANLSRANLHKADLSDADLKEAYLREADLIKANLRQADLRQADLFRAYLREANLCGANLQDANLSETDLNEKDLSGVNLSGACLAKVQALGTNFEKAKLTGACLQDWNINSATKLDDVSCDYVYLKQDQQERCPPTENFLVGEFSKLFQEIDNTVNLIFRHGINWKAFAIAFNQVNTKILDTDEQGEIFLREYKFLGNGLIALKVTTPPGVDKANLRDELMSAYQKIVSLEGEPKVTNELLALLYERLLLPSSQINLYKSTLIIQNNQQVTGDVKLMSETNSKTNKEYTFNGNVGSVENQGHIASSGNQNNIGNAVGEAQAEMKSIQHIHNYAPEHKQTLAEAAEEIQQLLDQLQTEGYNPETAQQKVARDLATKAQSNPTVKNKLVEWFQYLGDAAAKRLIGEGAVTVFKLVAQSLGIPIP